MFVSYFKTTSSSSKLLPFELLPSKLRKEMWGKKLFRNGKHIIVMWSCFLLGIRWDKVSPDQCLIIIALLHKITFWLMDLKIYLLSLSFLICKLDLRNQNFVQLRFILFSLQKSIYCGAHFSGIRFCCGVKFSLRSIKICKYLQRNISTMEIISQACRLIKAKVCSAINEHFHKLVFSLFILWKRTPIFWPKWSFATTT